MGVSRSKPQGIVNNLTCPSCQGKFQNELLLVQHFNKEHGEERTESRRSGGEESEFVKGDRVLAMWKSAKWQFFPATIVRKVSGGDRYEINWDDGDTTGRIVDASLIYLNVIPNRTNIQSGCKVLFRQGSYSAGETQETGGYRWHEGIITSVHQGGSKVFYSGHHTKGASDGKGLGYRGYDYQFNRLSIDQLRLSNTSTSTSSNVDGAQSYVPICTVASTGISSRKCVDLNNKFYLDVGDRVLAEWSVGQYYSAQVQDFLPDSKYLVDWDDGDTTGRDVSYYDITLDSVPRVEQLSLGSVIYFEHGATWHQGLVTNIHQGGDGNMLLDGKHFANSSALAFKNYRLDQLCLKIDVRQDGSLYNEIQGGSPAVPPYSVLVGGGSDGDLLKVGDRVLAMWAKSKWQYFHATIMKVLPDLQYKIEWDDGDTTGLVVDCFKIAKDDVPNAYDIGVGSIVLFPQGGYKAGSTQRSGGVRWHQGVITNITFDGNGDTLYDGCHTKGEGDGKWITYKKYSYAFFRMKRQDLRIGPNMFNIINQSAPLIQASAPDLGFAPPAYEDIHPSPQQQAVPPYSDPAPPYSPPSFTGGDTMSRIIKDVDPYIQLIEQNMIGVRNQTIHNADVFVSYCWHNSFLAKEATQIDACAESKLSDPRLLAKDISKANHKVWLDIECLENCSTTMFQQHAESIKTCRVFVPFISDQYAASMFCRMQFQYACGFQSKKIIPVIVGTGNEWKTSVIGLMMDTDKERFQPIDLQDMNTEAGYREFLGKVMLIINS